MRVTLALGIFAGSFTRAGSSRYTSVRTTNECVTTSALPPPAKRTASPASAKKPERRRSMASKRSARPDVSARASTSATSGRRRLCSSKPNSAPNPRGKRRPQLVARLSLQIAVAPLAQARVVRQGKRRLGAEQGMQRTVLDGRRGAVRHAGGREGLGRRVRLATLRGPRPQQRVERLHGPTAVAGERGGEVDVGQTAAERLGGAHALVRERRVAPALHLAHDVEQRLAVAHHVECHGRPFCTEAGSRKQAAVLHRHGSLHTSTHVQGSAQRSSSSGEQAHGARRAAGRRVHRVEAAQRLVQEHVHALVHARTGTPRPRRGR